MSRCDVVIVTYNSEETIAPCITPLLGATAVESVVVVDSASSDRTVEVAQGLGATVLPRENRGFGAGCNAGAEVGTCERILFLNPDSTVTEDSIAKLLEAQDLAREAGLRTIVSPSFDDSDPRSDPYFRAWFFPAQLLKARIFREPTCWDFEAPGLNIPLLRAERFSGAAFLIDRTTFESLGGFDETFFLYFEDADLDTRAQQVGVIPLVRPDANVVHANQHSSKTVKDIDLIRVRSNFEYVLTHKGRAGVLLLTLDLLVTTTLYAVAETVLGRQLAAKGRFKRLRALLPMARQTLRA